MRDNNKIEKEIYEQFNQRKPEIFDRILENCPNMIDEPKKESLFDRLRNMIFSRKFSYSFASLSMLVVLAFVLFGQGTPTPQTFSTIAIDVNPSVVLELDEEDKVIHVEINNEDAEVIVGDMDLIGVDYNVAINALIGSMLTNGYISDLSNTVLLSISSDNELREDELMSELSQAVNNILSGNQINGSVIVQDLEFEEEAEEIAELLGISEAKAELILDIIEVDSRMTVEELALLSINDLNLLLEAKEIALDNIEKTGSASVLGIITAEEAFQVALTELGINELSVFEFKVELEQEDGVMIYVVVIETSTHDYEIFINAKEGTVYVNAEDDNQDFPVNVLSTQEILDIVIEEYSLNSSLIVDLEFEQEIENEVPFYVISFTYNDLYYELEINAVSGFIYSVDIEQDEESPIDYELTQQEAINIALEDLSLTTSQVDDLDVEVEIINEEIVYIVSFDYNDVYYEYTIDVNTGEIYESTSAGESQGKAEDLLTQQEVLTMVLQELGLNSSLVMDVEYETTIITEITYYVISFDYNDDYYEITANATNGEIYSNSMDDE